MRSLSGGDWIESSAQVIGLREGYKEFIHIKREKIEYVGTDAGRKIDDGCSWKVSLYCLYFSY